MSVRIVPLVLASSVLISCGETKPVEAPPAPQAKAAPPTEVEPGPQREPQPEPPAEPAAAPGGAVLLRDPFLYVQTCAERDSCPQLKQEQGVARCTGLDLGGLTWRLPVREEAKRFNADAGLSDLETFHWTTTPYEEDGTQVWIWDPKTAQETTLPKRRRPFVVRCVADPPSPS